MSSGLSDGDRERIESFCETPSYDRSPEDLLPDKQYADDVRLCDDESRESLLTGLWHRLRNR